MLGLFQKSVPVFVLDLESHKQVLAEIDTRLKLAQQLFKEMQTWPAPVELWKKSWESNSFGVFQLPELSPKPKTVLSIKRQDSSDLLFVKDKFDRSGKKVDRSGKKVNPQACPVKYIPARCCQCGIDLVQGRALVNGDKVYCDKCNPTTSDLMNYFTLTPEEKLNTGSTLHRDGRLYQITEMRATSLGTRVQARRLF